MSGDGWEIDYGSWGSDDPANAEQPEPIAPPPPAEWSSACTTECRQTFAEQPASSAGGLGGASGGWIMVGFLAGCVFNSLLWRLRILRKAAKKAFP